MVKNMPDLAGTKKENRTTLTRCKNLFFYFNPNKITTDLRMSLSSLPHLIIRNKNEFLTH
jgi:hypothetical protein